MVCDQCGALNPDENNFCGQCGVRLLRHPVPAFAEAAKIPRTSSSLGRALSSLGVDDIDAINGITKRKIEEPIIVDAEPIKTAAFLQEETISPVLSSTAKSSARENYADQRPEPTTISGPSFLGLTDQSDDDQANYLLEDNGPGRGKAWIVFLILLAILGGIGWWNRDALKRAGFGIPFLHTAGAPPQSPATNPQPANNTGANASSAQPNLLNGDADRFTTTDPSAAADEKNTSPATGPATTTPPFSMPEAKADDSTATESSLSRQAQEAKQRQANQPSGQADTQGSSNEKSPAATNSKPERATADTQPDPRQNKLLLAGEKYLYGRGVPRSCEQAVVYFRAAAEQNNAPAMSHLAVLYNSGECVKQDTGQAYGWLLRAHDADPSNVWIERDLEIMKKQMASK